MKFSNHRTVFNYKKHISWNPLWVVCVGGYCDCSCCYLAKKKTQKKVGEEKRFGTPVNG